MLSIPAPYTSPMYPADKPGCLFITISVLFLLAITGAIGCHYLANHQHNRCTWERNQPCRARGYSIALGPVTYFENAITISQSITIMANTSLGGNQSNTIIDGQGRR